MARRTYDELKAEINALILDNYTEEISPADMRSVLCDIIDSIPFDVLAPSDATGRPSIAGTPEVGEELRADLGTIADADGVPDIGTFTWQWTRNDDNDIANALAVTRTYVVAADDVGQFLRVRARFMDMADPPNAEGPLTSAPVRGRAVPPPPRMDAQLFMAAKPENDLTDFTSADFLDAANGMSSMNQVVQLDGPARAGQWRIAFARRSDLGPATIIQQNSRPPNNRDVFSPTVGSADRVEAINGGDYFIYTGNITFQGFLLHLTPWLIGS